MKFYELLNSWNEFDCPMVIGGVEMECDLVWNPESRITEYGIKKFEKIMFENCVYNENENYIEVMGDENEIGSSFAMASAGYVADSEYQNIFIETDEDSKIIKVARIVTDKGVSDIGVQKRDGKYWVVGIFLDGTIEETEQNDESFYMALDSIKHMYCGDVWELEWI